MRGSAFEHSGRSQCVRSARRMVIARGRTRRGVVARREPVRHRLSSSRGAMAGGVRYGKADARVWTAKKMWSAIVYLSVVLHNYSAVRCCRKNIPM